MRWTEQPIFFVDFEGNRTSGVLEYGVVTLVGGQVVEAKTRLCGAIGRVRPEDTAVHGLRPEMVATQPPLSEDWDYFAGLRGRGPLAAHYAGVENGLLKSVWPYPRTSPDFADAGRQVTDWGPWIDSARVYAQLRPEFNSGKLEVLVAAGGLQAELDALGAAHCPAERRGYHAALYDALAGALLLAALARDPRWGDYTVRQLLALSTLDPGKRDQLTQSNLW
jgi:DNA polymerase III epsilon subunit-like protein